MEQLHDTYLRALLDKEQAGTLTGEEQAQLDAWYSAFDETQKNLQVFRDEIHEAAIKQRLLNRIMQDIPARKKSFRLYTRLAAAASLLALISFTIWKYSQPSLTVNENTVAVRKVTLPDGSTVLLNKQSKISYSFSKEREVYLTGEAFFDVKKDQRPFSVHTGKLTTHVLGTSFNIKTTPNSDVIEITVVQGKVAVTEQHNEDHKDLAVLLPDQRLSYNEPAHQIEKSNANAKLAVLWKEEDLKFENLPMQEVLPLLENRYGVQIKMASPNIKENRFTAYFLNTSSLTQVLNVITQLNKLSWTKEGDSIYIINNKIPD